MVELKNETDLVVADIGQIVLGQLTEVAIRQPHRAVRRLVECAEQIQQRALAGAGRPHNRHGRTRCELEIDIRQDHDWSVAFCNVSEFNQHGLPSPISLPRFGSWLQR